MTTALTPKDQATVAADKALAIVDGSQEWRDIMAMGKVMAMSGMFPDIRDQAQAVVKILAGKELGFGPIYSMTKISVVKGKVAVSSELMGAAIKRSGRYDYQVMKLDDNECVLRFTDRTRPDFSYESRWTMADAKRAELIKADGGWQKFPRAMLVARAMSQGARIVCPEVIAGVYTYEDFGIETTPEGDPDQKRIKIINEQSSATARPEVVAQAGPPLSSQGPDNSTDPKTPATTPAPGKLTRAEIWKAIKEMMPHARATLETIAIWLQKQNVMVTSAELSKPEPPAVVTDELMSKILDIFQARMEEAKKPQEIAK